MPKRLRYAYIRKTDFCPCNLHGHLFVRSGTDPDVSTATHLQIAMCRFTAPAIGYIWKSLYVGCLRNDRLGVVIACCCGSKLATKNLNFYCA